MSRLLNVYNFLKLLFMSVYIVTYDLHKSATPFDYERLVKLIKEEGSWACLGSSS